MRNLIISSIISLLCVVNISAQFNSLIFQKYLSPYKYGVVALGDQNSDGYDDILIYDCNEKKVNVLFGGSPMDTIPEVEFHIIQRSIIAMDVNGDDSKDIIITYQDTLDSNQKGKVNIYYGGDLLDTIPDIHFEAPEGDGYNFGWYVNVSRDFDGDSISELIIYDPDYPFNGFSQFGIFYFFKANPVFDTIPFVTIKGDTLIDEQLVAFNSLPVTIGDLDGDGLSDIAINGEIYPFESFIKFYKGNEEWNTEPFVTYYKSEHIFDPTSFRIINDINQDGRDDILISSYGEFYPYYYLNSILYGSIPIDTIPDAGLNTQNNAILQNVSPGDVNGDDYNDLLAGTTFGLGPEQARLWVGGNPMPEVPKQYWGGNFEGYGKLIGNVGDVNGDGLDDICVGQSQPSCQYGFVLIFAGDTLFQQPVSVGNEMNFLPEGFYLDNPYPNPFNPSTVISWQMAARSHVTIKVYDILGKEILTLVDEERPAGRYETEFNAVTGSHSGSDQNLSSGVYLISMTVMKGGEIRYKHAKKISLIK
jgi:hypothetical protein